MPSITMDDAAIEARKQFQAELVRRQLCCPSPTNPRKTFPEEEMLDMRASVKKHGILQPLLVRLWPADYPWQGDMMPLYEIVCGERRWRSADAEGLEFVPVVVKNLSNEEVQAIQIIENLQRADLHEMEEAEGYQRMMAEFGRTADELAEEVGKSKAYIYSRLKLTALCPEGREAFRAGKLNASTALLVARIPVAALQSKAVAEVTKEDWQGDLPSVREVKRILQQRYMLDLAKAPFSLQDATLNSAAGSCTDCPNRTGNQPELYADIGADVCTIPDCLQQKQATWAQRKIEKASKTGQTIHQGAAAKRIAPYGITSGLEQGYVALTSRCYEAPREADETIPTYQQLLDGNLPKEQIELLQDSEGMLHKIAKRAEVARVLAEKGIHIHPGSTSTREAEKKRKDEAKQENLYRAELFGQISSKLAAELAAPLRTYIVLEQLSPLLTATLMDRTEFEAKKRLARKWGYDTAGTGHHAVNQLRDSIPTLAADQRARLLIELCLIGEIHVAEYQTIQDPPRMTELATSFGLDPVAIRRASKPSTKQKASPPSTAAPAGEVNAPGAEPAKAASTPKKAAPAKGKVTPIKKSSGRACPAGENKKTQKVMNEKPKGADTSAAPEATRCDKTRDMFESKEAA